MEKPWEFFSLDFDFDWWLLVTKKRGGFRVGGQRITGSAVREANEALENEYNSYARRKPRLSPSYGVPPGVTRPSEEFGGGGDGYGYEKPQPNSGFQPGMNRPGGGAGFGSEYESGYGRKPEYERPTSEYGSEYGRMPEYERATSEYGSGCGGRSEYEKLSSDYASGYGRKSEYEEPNSEYGSGYGGSGYGRKEEHSSDYGSGYGRKSKYEEPSTEYRRKTSYGEEEGGGGYGSGPVGGLRGQSTGG
ncbi:unnamed protein product [Ilex paraguariensis]|uniref:Glycine-rich protein n=1 Tax=Ilex paraguariensis TaxID=185542 RepID=A0ABC8TBK4_9AQUA